MFLPLPALVFAAVLAGEQAPPPASGPVLAGTVRSAGLPIPGATVTAMQGARRIVTTTDDSGRYELSRLGPGSCIVEVQMLAFEPAKRDVAIDAAPVNADFTLTLRSAEVAAARPAGGPQQARANSQAGFRNLTLNQTTAAAAAAEQQTAPASTPAAPSDPSSANEAFLMNGTLSSGLQQAAQTDDLFGVNRGGFDQQGGFGQQGNAPGMQGQGGQGGPGGGFGGSGGGFGGRGGMGGPGGFGGARNAAGGRRPGGRPGQGPGMRGESFGNRAGRGRNTGVHGSAFFSLDNSALDARPYSLNGQTVEKPSYAQSRFGITAGGPLTIPKLIHDNKTFFFLSYFGTRARNPYNSVSTLPTPEERAGDFSRAVAAGPVQIYDPKSGALFPGNVIPADRLNAAARGLLQFIPLPNQPGQVQNYQYITSTANNSDNLGLRGNRTLTSKDRLDFNFNMQRRDGANPQLFGFRDETSGLGMALGAGWTHNLSATTLNNVRLTFSRNRSTTVPFFAYGTDVAAGLGITGVSQDPINYGPPNLSFTNFGALTDASPVLQRNQTAGVSDTVTLVRGAHTVTFGGEYRRMQINTRTDQNARGSFTFTGLATSAFNAQGQPVAGTGFDFADFLLGTPQSSSIRFGDTSTYFRASVMDGYGMEDWRVRSNLTLNFGLRYEFFTPYQEKYGHMANLDIAPGFTAVAVVTPDETGPYSGKFPAGLVNPDKNNFSPRIGIAWKPISQRQLLVRSGYGIFYNGSIYSQFPSRLAAQPPFANAASLNTSLANPLTIENGFAAAPSQAITNTYAVDRNYRVGYAQTWNFALQQSLPHNFVAEIGYLGTKGTRLDIQRLPNRAAPGSPLTAEERRRIGNAVGFTFDDANGDSVYHAGQARLMRRFSRGISVNALYTFSKSIDNASSIGGGAAVVAQNDEDLRAERGLSSFDRRHTLNLSYIISSPVSDQSGLLRSSRWAGRMLKDWNLSGGLTYATGAPLTARVLGNQADTGGTGAIGSGRAQATGEPIDAGTGFFNLAAFTYPLPGAFGNAGRNTIPGPSQLSLNLSFGRSFAIDERRRIEFRADSQNFLNRVSYTAFGTVVNAADYGLPTAAQGMRRITFTTRLRF